MAGTLLEDSSNRLLARSAAGDRAAFRALYDRHAPRLYAVALRILRQPGTAADALQDAFVQVWQNAGRFDPERGSAEAWMIGLVRYRALDVLRRAGPATLAIRDDVDELPDTLVAMDISTNGRALRQCMERLAPERRRMVVLAFVEGFSHAELSVRLAAPLGTIKSTIRRTLAALRECLEA